MQGQHVVVIGGSSGIGKATARSALQAGARVTIAARDVTRLKEAAADLGQRAIRINSVACGFVDTPLTARALGDRFASRVAELAQSLPIGRVVDPGDVAALITHLFCNGAITGAVTAIDGGQSLL